MAVYEFFIAVLHHYSCLCINNITLFFIFLFKCALEFCKVKSKMLGLTFKGKQNIFPNQLPLSSAASYLHSEATMMPIAIHSQQEPLICMLTQQRSLAVAQVVVSFLLSLLIYTICV
jgi:hypothetical protein